MSISIQNKLIITGLHTSVEVCRQYIAGPSGFFENHEEWPFSLDAIYPVPLNVSSHYDALDLFPFPTNTMDMVQKSYNRKKDSIKKWEHFNAPLWEKRIDTAFEILSSPVKSKLYSFDKSEQERQKGLMWKTDHWGTCHDVICFHEPNTTWSENSNTILGKKSEVNIDGKDAIFTIEFETTYNPPLGALNYLSKLFPTLHIILNYVDEYDECPGEFEIKECVVIKNNLLDNKPLW